MASSLEILNRIKERKQNAGQSAQSNGGGQGASSGKSSLEILEHVKQRNAGLLEITPEYDWLNRFNNVINSVNSYNAKRNGGWTADTSNGKMGDIDKLLAEYDSFSGNKDAISRQRNALSKYREMLMEQNAYYSQFRDGDDYDRTRSGYGNYGVGFNAESYGLQDQEARELRRQAYEKDKAAYDAGYGDAEAAVKALQQERRVAESRARLGDGKYNDLYFQDLERREKEAKEALNRNALVYKDRMDAYDATWGKIDRYADTMEQAKGTKGNYTGPGFQEAMDWQQRQWERATGSQPGVTSPSVPSDALEIGDKLGFWLSLTPEQQGQEAIANGSGKHWENLQEDEISTYYYLQQQQGQGAADQYLEDMQSELNRRADAKTIQQLQNTSGWGLVGKNAESVAANLIGSIPAAIGKAEELVTGKHDPYSGSSVWRRYASYIRGITGERVEDWTKRELDFNDTAATFANNVYQAVMSGVDSAAGGMLFGAGAGVPVGRFTMHVGGYTTVMGMGAFADRAQELQLKGASAEQIALGAVGSGVLEALFEDISLESYVTNILDNPATTLREFGKKLAVQMGVEASEEVFTEIGNMMWDAIVMGQSSDTQQAIRKYMEQGMDQDHARAQAIKDNALDIFWAGFGGAISAGAMSGVGQMAAGTVRSAQEKAGNFAVGREIVYNGQVRDLEGQARQLQDARTSEKLMKLARKAAGLYDEGEQGIGTAYKAGKVATGIAREAGREAARATGTEFRAAAEAYLAGREDITDKKRALNVLSRIYNKDTQLPGDQAAYRKLGGEKTVQAILDSVGGAESFQARVDQRRAASMRTAAGVQNSVLGVKSNDTGNIEYQSGGDGTALRKGTAEPVQITGIADTKGGLKLKTGDGDTVLAQDIVAGSRGEAAVLNAIDFMETNPYTAQVLWDASKVTPLQAEDFAKGLKDAYLQGRVGAPYESIQPYTYAGQLTDAQRKTAWTEGRTALEQYTKAQAEKVNSGAMKAAQKGVTVLESAQNVKSLNKQQKSAMAAANALAAVGLHIEVYASTPDDRAKGMPNGTYRKSDGGIAVDLNAGDGGQGAMAYALAHETTHFIKDFSAEKYKSYADLLIAEAQRQGIRYDSVFARAYDRVAHMEEYKGLDEKQLHDIAYDETIAEMSEMMLTDTDAIGRIAGKLQNQDRTLWEKIKDFFTGLVEKLRNAYQDAEPDSEIAKILKRAIQDNEALAEAWASAVVDAGENYQLLNGQNVNAGTVTGSDGNSVEYLHSERVTDKATLDFLNSQETVTTYKTMQLVDGKLYPPMAAVVAGSYEDYSELGKWEAATEHPELIKLDKSGKPKFTLNKGKGQGSLAAAYNPYMHSSNLVLNDQFSGAYTRPNLVTVECKVPVSELTSGYKAEYAKDSVGWHSWHTGTVAGALRQQTGTERQVLLSRWIMPVRIIPNSEVAQMYKQLLDGTDIAVPDNVVPPALLTELQKAGVKIQKSGRLDGQKKNAREGERYSLRGTTDGQTVAVVDEDILSNIDLSQWDKQTKKKVQAAAKEALKKFSDGIVVDGITKNVNRVSRNEYTGSKYSEKISKTMPQLYADKMRAANAIDDVVIAATDWARDGKLLHPRTDNFVDFDHGNVLIEVGRNQYVAEVVVGITNKGNAVFYDVVDIQPTQFTTIKEEPSPNVTTNKSPDIAYESSSDNTVPQQAAEVKGNVRYSSRNARDAEYMELAKDPEKNRGRLQKMVEDAAKEAGYTRLFYHGSKNGGGFTQFRDWQYFTENRDYAQRYAERGNDNSLYTTFVKLENPFDTRIEAVRDIYEDARMEYGMGELLENGLPDWTDGYDIADYIDENDLDYDSIVLDEGGDIVNGEPVSRGLSYIVRKSNQVKYADAVTYDDSGNVIPLSQRFDTANEDIRYSQRVREGDQVERLAKQNEVLEKEVEYLKELVKIQKRGNKDHILDRNSVNKQGKVLMDSVNAKGNITEFNRMLNDLYREISTVEMDYDTLKEKAGVLADWLLDHHQAEKDSYAQEILEYLAKRRVSLNEGQTGDIEYSYGSLNDFKKAIKGSVIIDPNANTSLDQLWQEAAARFPDRFQADTVDADMPDRLADVVEWANSSESEGEAQWQYYRAENRNDLIEQVLLGYWKAEPIQSVADKSRAEIAKLRQEHREAMQEVRKEKRQAVTDERARSNAAIEAYRAQRDAVEKAQKGLYEADRRMIEQQYAKQMKELRGQYSEDTKTMQTEFFRLLREYEKQQARSEKQGSRDTQTIQDLRDKLKQEANSHREDSTAWNREFNRLLREYETSGRKIDRLEEKVQKQRESAKAKVESRRRTEERAKIQKTLDTLNRYLLHPTDTVHVPQALQSSVAAALEAANSMILNSKSESNAKRLADYAAQLQKLEEQPEANAEKIQDLNRKIQNLTRQDAGMKNAIGELLSKYNSLKGDTLWDENIEGMIKECYQAVGNTAYRDLNLEQLQTVKNTYRALLTTIQNANKTFVAERNAGILDLVNRTRRELAGKPLKNTRQSGIGETYDKFSWNNEKPIYAFERIGSATLSELYRNLRAGEDTWARDVSEAKAFFTGSAARHGYDKWQFGTLETFTASDGTTFQLDLDERMSVYAYSLREQAREHLLQGGITLSANTQREVKGPLGWSRGVKLNDATAYALTTETLQAIADSLTPEQRAFAKEMQQYLSTVMGAKGNETSMALYGIKKYNERNYWPIKSSDRFSEVVRTSQEQVGKLKNKGMTKSTVEHANNPIEISGFIDTWGNHVSDMSMYHAFVLPMEDFSKVYNWHQTGDGMGQQSVGIRQLIEQTHGKGAVSYIDTFMKDLNGGIKADPRADVTRKMLSSFKKAAVTASLSVAIQQPSAVGRAFAYIEANYFVGEKVSGVRGTRETWEQMKKYAPGVVVVKDMGRFSMDMGMSVQDYIMGKDSVGTWAKVINKVDDVSGLLPEYADKVTWCAIWEAAKRKTAAMNPGLKGDALLYKAGELFSDTIQKTQVYDSVFSRSANMRSKDLLSAMTTSFMAEPTTTANMVEAAVRKLVKGDKRMGAKMLSAVATATVLNAVLASFVYAMRDKDQDKTYWEKYVSSLTAEMIDSFNPLTYVPILNDINSLLAGYSVNRTDLSLASDAIDTIKRLYTTYKRFDPDWDEEHKKEWEKKIRDGWVNTTLSMGNFLGLPLKNIYRDVSGMVNTWTNPSRKAEMSVDTILQAMHSSAKQNFPFISWTADESNSDQLYEAITAGKTVLANRIKLRFKDQAAYENAIRKGLRDNDPRIHQAAEYVLSVETEKRVRLIRDIVAEGHFDQDTVIKAINAEANSIKEKTPSDKEAKPEKLYSAYEYVNAQSKGLGYAQEIQKGIVQYNLDRIREEDPKLSRERAEDKAKERFQSAVRSETKIAYQDGDLDDSKARKVLLAAEAESEDSVEDKLLAWKTDAELGFEYDWSESQFRQYAKYIKPAGIPADIFDTFVREQKYIKGEDLNGDGSNDPYTTVANKAKYINSLPLTAAQKETLWEGIVDSKKTRARYRLW